MNCTQVQNHLSAWVDQQLEPSVVTELEQHLSKCAACQVLADETRQQHQELTHAFAEHRESSMKLANRVIAHLSSRSVAETSLSKRQSPKSDLRNGYRPSWLQLIGYLVAACAGFLLATVIFRPWTDQTKVANKPVPSIPFGDLAVGDDAVEVRTNGNPTWKRCTLNSQVQVGQQIRTGDSLGCELAQQNSPALRLDRETLVSIQSSENVELLKGRIWVNTDSQRPIQVRTQGLTISSESGSFDLRNVSDGVEVIALSGSLSIQHKNWQRELPEGRIARIAGDGEFSESIVRDPVMETNWLHRILVKKQNDPELAMRVEKIMAEMGRTKMENLLEREIRELGHSAAGPLIAFLSSAAPENQDQPRRIAAARLLADLASYADIRQLISLLSDEDDDVARLIENGLVRITGRRPTATNTTRPDASKWTDWLRRNLDSGI